MNLCKDCEFYHIGDCKHPNNAYTDQVLGEPLILNAFQQRTIRYYVRQCGSEGHWFSSKWALPEMLNCPEGHPAFIALLPAGFCRVHCTKPDCWAGPSKSNKEEAVRVWHHMVVSYRSGPKSKTDE